MYYCCGKARPHHRHPPRLGLAISLLECTKEKLIIVLPVTLLLYLNTKTIAETSIVLLAVPSPSSARFGSFIYSTIR